MVPNVLKKVNTKLITYRCKGTIWIIRLEDYSVVLSCNHTLTMNAHHGVISGLRPCKINHE